jgi:hypothetical protein
MTRERATGRSRASMVLRARGPPLIFGFARSAPAEFVQ